LCCCCCCCCACVGGGGLFSACQTVHANVCFWFVVCLRWARRATRATATSCTLWASTPPAYPSTENTR
jgi:hypothetical protein